MKLFLLTALLASSFTSAEAGAQARKPDSSLKEVIGTLQTGKDVWKATAEMITATETQLVVELNSDPVLKFREVNGIFDRGQLVQLKHSIYRNPVLVTVWERGVGSKVLRIFYPSDSTEPVFTVETPDEGLDFTVGESSVRIQYTDPRSLGSGVSDTPPKLLVVEWPPKTRAAGK